MLTKERPRNLAEIEAQRVIEEIRDYEQVRSYVRGYLWRRWFWRLVIFYSVVMVLGGLADLVGLIH